MKYIYKLQVIYEKIQSNVMKSFSLTFTRAELRLVYDNNYCYNKLM